MKKLSAICCEEQSSMEMTKSYMSEDNVQLQDRREVQDLTSFPEARSRAQVQQILSCTANVSATPAKQFKSSTSALTALTETAPGNFNIAVCVCIIYMYVYICAQVRIEFSGVRQDN